MKKEDQILAELKIIEGSLALLHRRVSFGDGAARSAVAEPSAPSVTGSAGALAPDEHGTDSSVVRQAKAVPAAVDGWVRIETPPDKDGHYLVWVKDGGAGWADQPCIEFYTARRKEWSSDAGIIVDGGEITHWQEIKPPGAAPSGQQAGLPNDAVERT